MTNDSPPDLSILEVEPGHLQFSAYRHDLHIMCWLQTPTVELVQRLDRAIATHDATHSHLISAVHIVGPAVGPPPPEVRTAFVELAQRHGERTASVGIVVERGGLLGLTVRSAVTGIIILAPKHYRVKVFDTIEACAPWVAEQHERVAQERFDAAGVLSALQRARASAL